MLKRSKETRINPPLNGKEGVEKALIESSGRFTRARWQAGTALGTSALSGSVTINEIVSKNIGTLGTHGSTLEPTLVFGGVTAATFFWGVNQSWKAFQAMLDVHGYRRALAEDGLAKERLGMIGTNGHVDLEQIPEHLVEEAQTGHLHLASGAAGE